MTFRLSENHLYLKFSDGRTIKLSLDAAEKLRAFLEKSLYRDKQERKKIKEVMR